uniref:Biotin--[acetyl-CoA-carboxylase] ligase n=1 Tax=Candidatus Methanomethylicus mesodigestus TaxID=1867258 RepID=A0A7C3EVY2_9CREN
MKSLDAIGERLAGCSFVSGESLASELGITRAAVFKHIQALRRQGYSILSVPGKGYKLEPRFDGLLPLEVISKVRCRAFGKSILVLDQAGSTQDELRGVASKGAPEGTVVLALQQSSGKGRGGRLWSSPLGGLWFSLLLRPKIPFRDLCKLSLLFGVAVARALIKLGVRPSLKWPNDVLVGGKKICGILLEASAEPDRVEYVLVGIGVNANFIPRVLPSPIDQKSTSILAILGEKIDRASLLSSILVESEELYDLASRHGFGAIIEEWKANSSMMGKPVRASYGGKEVEGIAARIDEDGSLVIKTPEGEERIYSGDVSADR